MENADPVPEHAANLAAGQPGPVSIDATLVVDVDGFEGPLDLLLHLARHQKVDLTRISVLALANQFLSFVAGARHLRLEPAADYLVMAAWLAYLKSRLLLPDPKRAQEGTAEELAAALQFRLRRLEAMRDAAARLVARDRLGRDMFERGMPQSVAVTRLPAYKASLHDLLSAYAVRHQKRASAPVRIARRPVWSLKQARAALARLLGRSGDWKALGAIVPASPSARKSALASSFAASLELAREGALELRQEQPFAPLLLRLPARTAPAAPVP